MIEIQFDSKDDKFKMKSKSSDSVTVLSEMTAVIFYMVSYVNDEIGHEEAQIFVNVVQKYMKIALYKDKGKEMIQ